MKELVGYVGTYTNGDSKGIYRFTLDLETGKIENVTLEAIVGNPTYLTIDKNNQFLYSVATAKDTAGVAAFSIKNSDGHLEALNLKLTEGSSRCYVSLDKNSRFLLTADYHHGEVVVYPLATDGSIMGISGRAKHQGSGPDRDRQQKPHVHYVTFTPDEEHVCVVDLGIDQVVGYEFHEGTLVKSDTLTLSLRPGCGPRHMVFHPNGKYAYVLTELSSEVVVLAYISAECRFKIIQYISALPQNYSGSSLGGAIRITGDGRFLYTSNRGHDSISLFYVDGITGKIRLVNHISTQGSHPRDFSIDPTGKYLVVANRDSDNVIPFLIDRDTGKLSQVSEGAMIPSAVCIKFLNK